MGELRVLDTAGDTERELVRIADDLTARIARGDVAGAMWCVWTHDQVIDEDYGNLTIPEVIAMMEVMKYRLLEAYAPMTEQDDE